jgi:hypothetical protein
MILTKLPAQKKKARQAKMNPLPVTPSPRLTALLNPMAESGVGFRKADA